VKTTAVTPASLSLWQRSGPALKAALLVSWVIVMQEVIGDALPVVGNAVFMPLWLEAYYVQGLLVGHFARRSSPTSRLSVAGVTRLGLVSALWTSVVFSLVVMIAGVALSTAMTAGAALVTFPLMLAGGLLDIVLNVSLTTLGAWLYAWVDRRWLRYLSCGVIALCLLVFCGTLGGAAAALYFWGGSLLQWGSHLFQPLIK
jgi:hypothetical protein